MFWAPGRRSNLNTDGAIAVQNFVNTLSADDVINYVINTNLSKRNHNPMILMYTKFNDDIFVRL